MLQTQNLRFNPLKRFPRNNPCFCGSAKKAKSCCMPRLSSHVYPEDEAKIKSIWDGLLAGTDVLEFKIRPRSQEKVVTLEQAIEMLPNEDLKRVQATLARLGDANA